MTKSFANPMDQTTALRAMYHGYVDLIAEFQESCAYLTHEDVKLAYEQERRVRRVYYLLQKARFDLNRILYDRLEELFSEITETEYEDIVPDDMDDDDCDQAVSLKTEEFFETLNKIMLQYILQN